MHTGSMVEAPIVLVLVIDNIQYLFMFSSAKWKTAPGPDPRNERLLGYSTRTYCTVPYDTIRRVSKFTASRARSRY